MKHYCVFSEAIRDGAKLRPQAFGEYFKDGKSCAIGAGAEAMGFGSVEAICTAENHFEYMQSGPADCPACDSFRSNLVSAITHLNDDHKWTREQIADWLSAEEEKLGFVLVVESETECLPITDREPERAGVLALNK